MYVIGSLSSRRRRNQQLDMLIFYAGAFGYVEQLEIVENGCDSGESLEANNIAGRIVISYLPPQNGICLTKSFFYRYVFAFIQL